jgi:hypothetical protein
VWRPATITKGGCLDNRLDAGLHCAPFLVRRTPAVFEAWPPDVAALRGPFTSAPVFVSPIFFSRPRQAFLRGHTLLPPCRRVAKPAKGLYSPRNCIFHTNAQSPGDSPRSLRNLEGRRSASDGSRQGVGFRVFFLIGATEARQGVGRQAQVWSTVEPRSGCAQARPGCSTVVQHGEPSQADVFRLMFLSS